MMSVFFCVGLQKLLMTIKTFGWKWGHQSYSNGGAVVTVQTIPSTIYTIIGLLRITSILAIFCCKGLGGEFYWFRHWAINGLNIQRPTFPYSNQFATILIRIVVSWWRVGAGSLLERYFRSLANFLSQPILFGYFSDHLPPWIAFPSAIAALLYSSVKQINILFYYWLFALLDLIPRAKLVNNLNI